MCGDFEGVNPFCKPARVWLIPKGQSIDLTKDVEKQLKKYEVKMTKTAKILYRTTKYGTWQPASIVIPEGTENVRQYCIEDLQDMKIKVTELTVEKTVNQ